MSINIKRTCVDALDAWELTHPNFKAIILEQGAQLLHFSTNEEDNWLWVGEKASFKKGQAVRGGIPICWPIFGAYEANPQKVQESFAQGLPQHGLARIQDWTLYSMQANNSGAEITFTLSQVVQALRLDITFAFTQHDLSVQLKTTNTGQSAKTITQALHTYLPTNDINLTTIEGLEDISYTDSVLPSSSRSQQHGSITFYGETDRIYHASGEILVHTPTARYRILSKGSQSTVIWNPGQEKAKNTSQLRADDYLSMVCVETANVLDDAITLNPNTQHTLAMSMTRDMMDAK